MTDDPLPFVDVERLMDVDTTAYQQRVLALFISGRASQAQWLAMAAAVLHVSMSADGDMVASIDRAVLAQEHAMGHDAPPPPARSPGISAPGAVAGWCIPCREFHGTTKPQCLSAYQFSSAEEFDHALEIAALGARMQAQYAPPGVSDRAVKVQEEA